jgi:predicted AAA+ superfamily ATPase
MEKRSPYLRTWQDLANEKSMVFLVGPRQAGKTTLAKLISQSFTNSLYVNWDIPQDRASLIRNPTFFESVKRRDPSTPLVIFDEIHKYKDWKNYLKGVYDQFHGQYHFLISGSGRLDIYQKGGDSLAGRYFLFHLWPFTIAELGGRCTAIEDFLKDPLEVNLKASRGVLEKWKRLSSMSGFPEPYLANRTTTYRRWSVTYSNQLIREDIRDLTGIKSIGDLETLYHLLPSKVGSPLSVPSLASDLKVSYNTVQIWLSVFERFFLIFSISPWTTKIARSIRKERKIYLWDIPRIQDPGTRFENMVALELWRAVASWNDLGYGAFSLYFLKNKEKQEVDFLIANGRKPFLLIEAKLSETQPSPPLRKFQGLLNVPAVQLNNEEEGFRKFSNDGRTILVAPAFQWLSGLP